MKLKLKHRQHIDARKPELDDRIEELAKELCLLLNRPFGSEHQRQDPAKQTVKLISSPNVIPKTIFYGRNDILSEIHSRFQREEHVLFLHGIGGIGKTQIAKQYAKKHKYDYDTIIYITYNSSIKDAIIAETPFIIEPSTTRLDELYIKFPTPISTPMCYFVLINRRINNRKPTPKPYKNAFFVLNRLVFFLGGPS